MAIRWDDLDDQDDGEFDMFAAWIVGCDPGPTLAERLAAWRPAWQAEAACRDLDAAVFFPADGEPADAAVTVCARCPVRDACGDFGRREPAGVWGGQARGTCSDCGTRPTRSLGRCANCYARLLRRRPAAAPS